jgi:hypothetical protein
MYCTLDVRVDILDESPGGFSKDFVRNRGESAHDLAELGAVEDEHREIGDGCDGCGAACALDQEGDFSDECAVRDGVVAAVDVDVGLTVEDDETFAADFASAKYDAPSLDVAGGCKSVDTTKLAGGTGRKQVDVVESAAVVGTEG